MNISKFNIGDRCKTDIETVGYETPVCIANLKFENSRWMYRCYATDYLQSQWYEEFDLILVRAI